MSTSYYVTTYQNTTSRYSEGCKDDRWEEWLEELGKIKAAWKSSVAGMLTQLDTNGPEIWHALGDAFHSGHGIERDLVQAEEWFRKAAESGHVHSMIRLGLLLKRDGRSPEDLAESIKWFRRAADLGNASGMTWLGFAYRDGTGVAADERQAADWFIKAYAAGSKNAAHLAGCILGRKPENHRQSVKWLQIAVDEGHELSNYALALTYEDRASSEFNAEEAFHCWSRVAELPSGSLRFTAMLTLARWCRDGIGTQRDRQQAIHWLDRLLSVAPKEKSIYRFAAKLRKEIDEELL